MTASPASPSTEPPATARSPFAGCTIMIAVGVVMLFLVTFSVTTLFRQFNEIEKFTAEHPAPQEVSVIEGREAELNALSERLEAFRQQLDGDAETSLTLTVDDFNLAIAAYDPLKELRRTFRVLAVKDGSLEIAISFQLNGKPRRTRDGESGFVTSDPRYLNGILIARPSLQHGEVVLLIDDIQVPGATVPPEFIGQMSPYRVTERYMEHSLIGPAMKQLTRIGTTGEGVTFQRIPGETPAGLITDSQVDAASNRFFTVFAIGASFFLAFVAIVIFVGMRAKRRRIEE